MTCQLPKLFNTALLAIALALASCTTPDEQKTELPPGVLSEEQFAKVLADFALAESAANQNIKSARASALDTVYPFDPLKDHGVRKSQYDSTLEFYSLHPRLYRAVYERVMENLSALESARDTVTAPQN
jgi:hypothetical protein